MIGIEKHWVEFAISVSILGNLMQGSSLGEQSLAGRKPFPKVPRSSQQVSGGYPGVLAGRGRARWASTR
ncbi:hypothetical protein A2U01_0064104 [Trifolium medium]|uniref:Uncharacterized protein n=1 Tax=Trifolium medium TaxID=97028 RepID=A0A392S3B3_9FABA|nr:hypothetical protein [Trifolium medium]